MTVEIVAQFCGRELVLDGQLEEKIASILNASGRDSPRWTSMRRGPTKAGDGASRCHRHRSRGHRARCRGPACRSCAAGAGELQPMWPIAVETPAVQEAIAGRTNYRQATVRMFGLPESGLAESLREAEDSATIQRLEITTCLRRGEVEMVTRYEPDAAPVYAELMRVLRERHARQIFLEDGARVDDQVSALLTGRRIATASRAPQGWCGTADRPCGVLRVRRRGGSGLFQSWKSASSTWTRRSSRRMGRCPSRWQKRWPRVRCAASAPTRRWRSPASPDPTGNEGQAGGDGVFCELLADGPRLTRTLLLPGNRSDIRERSTTVGMYLLRRTLLGAKDPAVLQD